MSRRNRKWGVVEVFCRRHGISYGLVKAGAVAVAALAYLASR